MSERARRVVFATLLVLAVAGAAGLMASGLLGDPFWRMRLQIVTVGVALVCGTVCGILAWRWWSDQLVEDRRSHR
jgi:hypothetical protein